MCRAFAVVAEDAEPPGFAPDGRVTFVLAKVTKTIVCGSSPPAESAGGTLRCSRLGSLRNSHRLGDAQTGARLRPCHWHGLPPIRCASRRLEPTEGARRAANRLCFATRCRGRASQAGPERAGRSPGEARDGEPERRARDGPSRRPARARSAGHPGSLSIRGRGAGRPFFSSVFFGRAKKRDPPVRGGTKRSGGAGNDRECAAPRFSQQKTGTDPIQKRGLSPFFLITTRACAPPRRRHPRRPAWPRRHSCR